ncbi:MAG: LamG-like jellyroll fold domain-containing protein [Bacteroidota bacterium]
MKKSLLLFSIVALAMNALNAQVSRNGLLATYKFDGNYNDSTANKRHALWANTTFVADRNGTPNSAISFNGDDGFVTSYIGSHENLSVAFWFKPDNQVDPYPHMWDYGNYDYRGMIMAGSVYGGERHKVYSGTNYPNEVFTKSASTVTYNQWQHIAFVFDKTSNKIQIYMNGTFSSEATITSSLSPSDSTIMFGRVKNSSLSEIITSNYKGAIDDIYIFNRALNAQDIASLKDGNFSSLGVPNVGGEVGSEDIVIYPNPTKTGFFNIDVKKETIKVSSIKLFDITGKLVFVTYETTVNTTQLAAGTYLVQVNGENNVILTTERIVVE